MDNYEIHQKYEDFEYDDGSRQAHSLRKRPLKNRKRKEPRPQQVRATLTDFSDDVADFVPSYAAALDPLHFERRWVIESVGPFYRNNQITDVTQLVKGGKEANVYVCTGHPATGHEYLAVKLYRPRMLRHLKNDAVYKAGRQLRDAEGKQIKGRRVKLALKKKTSYGKYIDIMWWIGNEFSTQQKLYEAGADVPKPISHQDNGILMEFVGDEQTAAPTLSQITLERDEAESLFKRVMHNVALMLEHHLIHGDLSAYNILYWEGKLTLIDFPQMVEARHNPHAFELFQRDVTRVCQYFARFGVRSDPVQLTLDLWEPYMGGM